MTEKGICPCISTSNEITHSCLILQYKRKYDHLQKMIMTQYPSSSKRGMPLCKHIEWNLSSMSHTSKWKECLITSREWLWIKIHHCLREICPCVKLTKSNYPTTPHTPMWKKHLITSGEWLWLKIHHSLRRLYPNISNQEWINTNEGYVPT